jgi:integrase
MLKEGDPRQGFFEHEEYLAILEKLPVELHPIVTFAYRTGWRKREILDLIWDRVNLKERLITLRPDQTKNKESRSLYLDDELLILLKFQQLRKGQSLYVFNRNGENIRCFRKAWKKACKEAKLSGKLFHDFRRTAARNLTRSGVQETVAMKITGHKTRSIFDRYNITSQDDIRAAVERQEKYLSEKSVTKIVTIGQNSAVN